MILLIILYIILTVSGLTLFKLGTMKKMFLLQIFKFEISAVSLLGIVCYGCSFLTWLYITSKNDISYIYPIANGLVTIATILSGILFLSEKVNIIQWLGVGCIVIGIAIINIFRR